MNITISAFPVYAPWLKQNTMGPLWIIETVIIPKRNRIELHNKHLQAWPRQRGQAPVSWPQSTASLSVHFHFSWSHWKVGLDHPWWLQLYLKLIWILEVLCLLYRKGCITEIQGCISLQGDDHRYQEGIFSLLCSMTLLFEWGVSTFF